MDYDHVEFGFRSFHRPARLLLKRLHREQRKVAERENQACMHAFAQIESRDCYRALIAQSQSEQRAQVQDKT